MGNEKDFYKTLHGIKIQSEKKDEPHNRHSFKIRKGQFRHKEEDEFDTDVKEERGAFFVLDDSEPIEGYNKKE